MTENEWQVSTDPQAMYAFVRDRVTERQMRLFVEACRRSVERPWPFRTEEINWGDLAEQWCDRMVFNKDIPESVVCGLLREIIGNPFSDMQDRLFVMRPLGMAAPSHGFKPSLLLRGWLTWNNSTVPNLIDVMLFYNLGVTRAEPLWDMMPIIADALEEAGCAEAAILDHLRGAEPCPHCPDEPDYPLDHSVDCTCGHKDCPGVYLARCEHCNGTGKRPVRHCVGCWAVELLKE